MAEKAPRNRRGRILFSILALLFAVGVVPLVWTSWELVSRSRESIESNQKEWQLDKARLISTQVAIYVDGLRTQVAAIARTLEVDPGAGGFAGRLARIKEQKALERYLEELGQPRLRERGGPDGHRRPVGARPPRGREAPGAARARRSSAGSTARPMISVPVVSESLQEPVVVIGEPVTIGGPRRGRRPRRREPAADPRRSRSRAAAAASSRCTSSTTAAGSSRTPTPTSRSRPTSPGSRSCGSSWATPRTPAAAPPAPERRSGTGGTTRFDIPVDGRRPAAHARHLHARPGRLGLGGHRPGRHREGVLHRHRPAQQVRAPRGGRGRARRACWARSWPARSAARCRSWPTARAGWPAATTRPA